MGLFCALTSSIDTAWKFDKTTYPDDGDDVTYYLNSKGLSMDDCSGDKKDVCDTMQNF